MPPTTRSRGAASQAGQSQPNDGQSISDANVSSSEQNIVFPTEISTDLISVPQVIETRTRKKKPKISEPNVEAVSTGIPQRITCPPLRPSVIRQPKITVRSPFPDNAPLVFSLQPVEPSGTAAKFRPIRQKLSGVPVSTPLIAFPNPSQQAKHSLRLVRGTSFWTVAPPTVINGNQTKTSQSAKSSSGKLLTAVLTAKRQPKSKSAAPKKLKTSRGGKTRGIGKGRKRRRGNRSDESLDASSTTHSDIESFQSDGDTIAATSSTYSQPSEVAVSPVEGESAISAEETVGLGPNYSALQKEAINEHFNSDTAAANRYTALKEWAVAKGTRLFHGGMLKNTLRSMLREELDAMGQNSLSVDMFEEIKDKLKQRAGYLDMNEFKRELCVEIIKSRKTDYCVYKIPENSAGETSQKANVDPSA